jgi:hypothetical protein
MRFQAEACANVVPRAPFSPGMGQLFEFVPVGGRYAC